MRMLRRNTTLFAYRPCVGTEEKLHGGYHTGVMEPKYGNAVRYRGNISIPSGQASDMLYGIDTQYTHVLVMDMPDADIQEDGLIEWKDGLYEVKAVRRSLNVLSAALKKRTGNGTLNGAEPGVDPWPKPVPDEEGDAD